MKKLILVLFITAISALTGVFKEVGAVSINFDYGPVSPRFQYIQDLSGETIPFQFEFIEGYDSPEEVENIAVALEQVDINGVFIKTLSFITTDFQVDNGGTPINVTYDVTAVVSDALFEYINITSIDFISISGVSVNGVYLNETDYGFYNDEVLYLEPSASNIGDAIRIYYYKETESTYTYDMFYDWSGLEFKNDNIVFYRLRYDLLILSSGAVSYRPLTTYMTNNTYGIETGDSLVEDLGYPTSATQEDITTFLVEDKYIMLHYRIPTALITAQEYKVIQVTNLLSNTIETSFTTDDILELQGGASYDHLNSFIIIPLEDKIPVGLKIGIEAFSGWSSLLHNYEEGSYLFAMVDQDDSYSLLNSSSLLVNITEDYLPFELFVIKDEVYSEDLQRVGFAQNSDIISSSYETTYARDVLLAEDFTDSISGNAGISYYLDDLVSEGGIYFVRWTLRPSSLPYGLDGEDYSIRLEGSYLVLGDIDIEGKIDNLLVYYAFDTTEGGYILSALILLVFNGLLLLIRVKSSFIYTITNMSVVSGLSFMGFVPMWAMISLVLIAIIGFKMSMSGGSNYE